MTKHKNSRKSKFGRIKNLASSRNRPRESIVVRNTLEEGYLFNLFCKKYAKNISLMDEISAILKAQNNLIRIEGELKAKLHMFE